jgi:hypothetical protein
MPYIKSNDGRREALQKGEVAQTAGELNYQLFYHIKHFYPDGLDGAEYFRHYDRLYKALYYFVKNFIGKAPNYQRYNDLVGALNCCQKEVRRRLGLKTEMLSILCDSFDDEIAKYENKKIDENGDVE